VADNGRGELLNAIGGPRLHRKTAAAMRAKATSIAVPMTLVQVRRDSIVLDRRHPIACRSSRCWGRLQQKESWHNLTSPGKAMPVVAPFGESFGVPRIAWEPLVGLTVFMGLFLIFRR
jgi:hypothetical protein